MPGQFSTDQFADGQFRSHGHYELHLEDGIFVGIATGPFNVECLAAISKARKAALADWKDGAPVNAITVFKSSMLMSPQALDAYSRGLEQDFKNISPLAAFAWVVGPDVEGRGLMMEHFTEIFERSQIQWRVFENLAHAKAWIASKR